MHGHQDATPPDSHALLKKYYLIFFAAGLPALVYQVAWQRVLTLYFGVDLYSTTVTVGSFMLGLGAGSLLGGQVADRVRRPALAYAGIELLVGLFGVASVWLFSSIGALFAGGSLGTVLAANFALLLVPSTLMGMTLPLMCRIVDLPEAGMGRHLSWLYGVNTLGAAMGALLTSYLLLGLLGIDGTTWLAAVVNIALAYATLRVHRRSGRTQRSQATPADQARESTAPAGVLWRGDYLLLSFLSGLVGLGYEVVWCRVLGCLLHGTVYVFGTVLAFYLLGIGAGSLASRRGVDLPGAERRFALSQAGIALYSTALFVLLGGFSWLPGLKHLIGASAYTSFHPAPELFAGRVNAVTLYSLFDIPFWTVVLVGVPTFLMGYGFPNLLRGASRSVESLGRSVASVYFANILGATTGTLLVGFYLLHEHGAETTLLTLALAGYAPMAVVAWRARKASAPSHAIGLRGPATAMGAAAVIAGLTFAVFPSKGSVIEALHYADFNQVEVVAAAEDRSGVVVLKNQRDLIAFPQEARALNQYRLYIDGSNHGGIGSLDQTVEDRQAPLALAAHPNPKNVLCVGLGNGAMCVAAERWPEVERLVVVELNSALASVLAETANGKAVLDSPKTTLVRDDGRRWLLANPEEAFDVIMMFPLHAAHAHSGNLFSLEFFELLAERLTPDGVLFFHSVDCYSTAKTVATAFPHVLRVDGAAYMASRSPLSIDLDRAGCGAAEFLRRAEADRDTILANTRDAPLNRDLRPRAEFYVTYAHRAWLTPGSGLPVYETSPKLRLAGLARGGRVDVARGPTPPEPR